SGYNFGVGVDFKVTDNFFLGAEFQMREMGGSFEAFSPGWTFESHTQSVQLRAGFSF
ncbi:MAG: hypothetical protein GY952_18505, partial [Rhodobacteraceae bacterium]|nr:hypothetical protein [Paracoccaceae bacterium]